MIQIRFRTPILVDSNVTNVYTDPTQAEYEISFNRFVYRKTDGYLYGMGHNAGYGLGLGTTADVLSPTQLTAFGQVPLDGKKRVWNTGADYGRIFVHNSDNKLMLAGSTQSYSSGYSSATNLATPTDITAAWFGQATVDEILQIISPNSYHSTAGANNIFPYTLMLYKANASSLPTVVGCGDNGNAQLGVGNTTNVTVPTKPTGLPTDQVCTKISSSGPHGPCFALYENGDLWAWGYGGYSCLGTGNTGNLLVPTIVQNDVKEIFLPFKTSYNDGYYSQTTIKKADGHLYMCGYSNSSYLIPGVSAQTATFQKINLPGNKEIVDLGSMTSSKSDFTYVAKTIDNRLYVWGNNGESGILDSSALAIQQPIELTFFRN